MHTRQENVYPKAASVQFYKLFLDMKVRAQLAAYDALALIEGDTIVAHNQSFEMLYRSAFGGVEPFWVKGSTLAGTNFHATVVTPEQRHVVGHLNGNAIYNNTDPEFVEYVNYTRARWNFDYSYDVALWSTISDFPYSWPLWQRYSGKFVATNLIANVGFMDVNHQGVLKATERSTVFIHGSRTGSGGAMYNIAARSASIAGDAKSLHLGYRGRVSDKCKAACGGGETEGLTVAFEVGGTSAVCDRTCAPGSNNGARFGGFMCGAGDAEKYGSHCRLCYTDVDEARTHENLLLDERAAADKEKEVEKEKEVTDYGKAWKHVVMCDTLLPPPPVVCGAKCAMKVDTVRIIVGSLWCLPCNAYFKVDSYRGY